MRRLLVLVAVLGLTAMLGLTACTSTPPPVVSAGITLIPVAERAPAPAISGELLDGGGTFRLADHAGDVIVVNFWGSWCSPCEAEADDLEGTYVATKASGVTFLGVNIRDHRDAAVSFARFRMTYPSVFDPSSRLALEFDVPPLGVPSTFLIDREGRVAAEVNKALVRADLEPAVAALAAEPV